MSHYASLFEPVAIGPVTAPNRFYQVPHACGMGHLRPQAHAAMRATKARGGWGVVCTEECEIHPSTDLSPYPEQRLWDEQDIPALSLMVDAVHAEGALAGIELVHNGHMASNLYTRLPVLSVGERQLADGYPKMARVMDKSDIRELRRWHRTAARNAKQAGFDIVYVYAGHEMTLPQHFLLSRYNQRTDEYGGSLENRARLIRELLEETKEEVGDTCAVALRLALDENLGAGGMQAQEEGRAVVEHLAHLPDLWDVNVSDWTNDTLSSRFEPNEGAQVDYMRFVRQITGKPVVGVGRYSSPDLMTKLVRDGVLDLIGAARPSIADPYLPTKIKEGRIDDIRECIGCNICASCEGFGVPIRCTQNPTMGEEWRRGWDPEGITNKRTNAKCLVVGAGPAGLECALQLGRRGYDVTLAEQNAEFGGRALLESGLKGLSPWKRVADNRLYALRQMPNVAMFTDSTVDADMVTELAVDHVFLATGATWRKDATGRTHFEALDWHESLTILTPDDIMRGAKPEGRVVIYDDDHGYMGGTLATHLAHLDPVFLSTASIVAPFTTHTLEQEKLQTDLTERGLDLQLSSKICNTQNKTLIASSVYGGPMRDIPCDTLIVVTARQANMTLANELADMSQKTDLIGDALAPGLIADATFSGHFAARSFEESAATLAAAPFRREKTEIPPHAATPYLKGAAE
ncbi:MAG: FAD-dependent oxidoreductase [Pseudomonadota bacterium]